MAEILVNNWALDDAFGIEHTLPEFSVVEPECYEHTNVPPPKGEEHRENIRQSLKKYYSTRSPKIAKSCVYEGVEYPSYAAAARANGLKCSKAMKARIEKLNNPKPPRVHKRDKRTGRFI